MINIHQIHALADDCPYDFRWGVQALSADQECLGMGADLSVATLLHAYRSGVFPWFHDEPIAWWSPNPRCVLTPSDFIPKKSLIRKTRQSTWTLTTNHAFADVIQDCFSYLEFLPFTHKFQGCFHQLCEKFCWYFDWDCIKSVYQFWKYSHSDYVGSAFSGTGDIFLLSDVLPDFLFQSDVIFIAEVFCFLI